MASSTEICNLALSHLGVGKEIANLETEQSQEASACRRFYELARSMTLRDHHWPFATRYADLALVEEDPNSEWDFSYRYPTGCLKIRKILSGKRNDSYQSRVPYSIAQDSAGRLIFTDWPTAEITYTFDEVDPDRYTSDFIMALSFRLAHFIAPRLTGGDPYGLGKRALDLYAYEISVAAANAFNEEQADQEVLPEIIRSRE
jgi:hypothetical protein